MPTSKQLDCRVKICASDKTTTQDTLRLTYLAWHVRQVHNALQPLEDMWLHYVERERVYCLRHGNDCMIVPAYSGISSACVDTKDVAR